MDIKYVYVKTRADFGKQCIFDICGPNLDEEIKPHPQEMRNYILKSPCHVGTQYSKQMALHEVQTSATTSKSSGMYHFEGGWPKEIHPLDHETTARFRRRVEKDDEWAPKLRNLLGEMEHSVLLNNTINIHEHYFDDMIPTPLTQKRNIRLVNVFPDLQTPARPVRDIGWSPDDTKMVVSYGFTDVQKEIDHSTISYIWDLESPNKPFMDIEAPYQILSAQFNPRDPFVLAGGLETGQVCYWDVRKTTKPARISNPRFSHRYATSIVKWISTKTNTEFFSTSWDGQVLWWDTRYLRQPIDQLIFDLENPNDPSMERAVGISSANFEPAMSTKFLFGLQNGIVVSGSRKVKTNAEKLALRFSAHSGPVVSVDRNVFNPKVFLSVGNSTTRIWAEDTREGSLTTIRSRRYIATKACWNKTRHSLFYIIKENGQLEVYDVLESMEKPIVELHLSMTSLTTMAPHENGYLLAVGDKNGDVFLTQSSEILGKFERHERNNMTAGLERNSKHVKAVDARVKEMKIIKMLEVKEEPVQPEKTAKAKKKAKQQVKIKETDKTATKDDRRVTKDKTRRSTAKRRMREDAPEIIVAEEVFFNTLEKEKEKLEADEDPDLRYSTFVRKFDQKHLKRRAAEEEKEAEEKEDPKKKKRVRRRRTVPTAIAQKRISMQSGESQDAAITQIHEAISDILTDASVKEIVPSTRRVRKGKRKRKTKEKKFPLRLRRPCKVVCQPKVCCWRKIWRSRKDDIARLTGKIQEQEVSELREEETTSLQDEGGVVVKATIIRDIPDEFNQELSIARRELQRSKKPVDWTQRKRLVASVLQARARAKRRAKKLRAAKSQEKVDEKYPDLTEVCSKPVLSKPTDPCKPRESWTVMKEIETMLTPKEKDSEECEAVRGRTYLEELEAVQSRVYPRISDFYSTE